MQMIAWKTKGTALYQALPKKCRTLGGMRTAAGSRTRQAMQGEAIRNVEKLLP